MSDIRARCASRAALAACGRALRALGVVRADICGRVTIRSILALVFKGLDRMTKTATARIDQLLGSLGYGSRGDIARMAKSGWITLDDTRIWDATTRIAVTPDLPARMIVSREPLDPLAGMVILLHKPLGMTCSHKEDGPLVYDILPDRWKRRQPVISTVGRLDKQTSGLLLLTDDGPLLHRIISPKRQIKKTYRATLARPLDGTEGAIFAAGELVLQGEDKPLAPADLRVISPTEAVLTVTEGRYHQVRRMFAATGNHVTALHREGLGGLVLPVDLLPGQWTLLDAAQIAAIFDECACH